MTTTKSVVKSFKMQPDLINYIEVQSKQNGLTQSELIRVAIRSIKKETLDKIKEVRELVAV
ncbi:hypothetical protein [Nostoc sp. 'Peltigera malacea cyanobiont' DB3992]|uniref:hypothetical protein n=1 Tax=Nostoc sp. 'Peltigera malacea cyanobiont' DB3992 TaxID=1206980 RepID=UPI000C045F6E|nr:hypothetical protein [Nostoc sp. 'Peltigera malacea cyanobiont' DB3992]PHM09457.1 hypothetical protein CK516_14445 [Nostoc sp. 'Peltigera malacea cyanobiont' DB3992]